MVETKSIPMSNDPHGYVKISRSCLWIKFFHLKEKFFRIEVEELLKKLNSCKDGDSFPLGGLTFYPGDMVEGGLRRTSIELDDVNSDIDLAVVSSFDLREALYYFVY
jgi:hypothetical protein